ncbi:ricin-type beta-trefoil lectin domain protein, partial [[Clostridium] methylpentosum DSM 5476]
MKKKWMLKATACILTVSMLLSAMPLTTIVSGHELDQPDPLPAATAEDGMQDNPREEEDREYKIIAEDPAKKEEYTKHFLTEQQTYVAAMYDNPVHYEVNGVWRDIDNQLVLRAKQQVYENRFAAVDVKIAQRSNTEDMVTVERDGHEISWGMAVPMTLSEDGSQSSGTEFTVDQNPQPMALAAEEEPVTQEEIKEYNRQQTAVDKTKSSGTYHDILPNTDLQYVIQSNTVKENIIVKDRSSAGQAYVFRISHAGYSTRLEEDGSVSVVSPEDPDTVIFSFVKPFMYDAQGETSEAVEFLLESGEESSILILSPDTEWMESEDREYPIVIDPYTETSKETKNIMDTFVADFNPRNETFYGNGSFLVGKNSSYGKCTGLIKFNNLPQLSPGDIIYKGMISLYQYQFGVAEGSSSFNVIAYQPTSSWDPYDWRTCPSYSSTVLDYFTATTVPQNQAHQKFLDVTKLVRDWYNTGVNNGVLLRSDDENRLVVARFFTSDYPFNTPGNAQVSNPQEVYPTGIIYYKNATGLEDYWSYHEQPVGRAGTGYTNDFTGNLVFTHDDAATSGTRMPVSVKHIYNLSESDNNNGGCGYGWKLNVCESFKSTGIPKFPYVYTDGDGTKHYFYTDNKDEDGLGMEYTAISEGDLKSKITRKDKTVLKFDSSGNLRKAIDPNGNTISYNYTNGMISSVEDGAGHTIWFYYDDWGCLTRMVDQIGRTTWFYWDNGNLHQIAYPDNTISTFYYEGDSSDPTKNHRLVKAVSPDGYTIEYSYTKDFQVPRVSKIVERNGEALGQTLKISYKNGNTTVFEDNGLDGNIDTKEDNISTTYHFDNLGKPTDVYDQDGNANNYKYYSQDDNIRRNKLSTTGQTMATSNNPLDNPGFDNDDAWHDYRRGNNNSVIQRVTDEGYTGLTSMKVTAAAEDCVAGTYQARTLDGGTYTLSAYVKTDQVSGPGGAVLRAAFLNSAGQSEEYESTPLTGTVDVAIDRGWKRLSVTFEVPSEGATVTVVGCLANASGTAWFDCMQIDKGDTEKKYNLIYNPSFELGDSRETSLAKYWTSAEQSIISSESRDGKSLGRLIGKDGGYAYIQSVNISGTGEGDTYVYSCWGKADSLSTNMAEFVLVANVLYTDSTSKRYVSYFNPYITDWQFNSMVISTDDGDPSTNKQCKEIRLYANYNNNRNIAYVDSLQLIKDDSQSYVYDDSGNLITAKSSADKSAFVYDKDDNLSKLTEPSGSSFEYGYNEKKNLNYARNSEGVKYQFSYDSYGNPTDATIQNDRSSTAVTAGHTYRIRNKTSGKYLDVAWGNDTNSTNVDTWEYNGGANQRWKVVDAGGGYFKLVPSHTANNMVLDVYGAYGDNGTNVEIYQDNGSDAQKFKFVPKEDGSYEIVAKCANDKGGLDNSDGGTANGTNVKIWSTEGGGNNYRWFLEEVESPLTHVPEPGKIYNIRNRNSGQYLEVLDSSTASNTSRISQNFYSGKPNQQFLIQEFPGEEGFIGLVPQNAPDKVVTLCLDSDGGYCPATLTEPSDSNEQRYKLIDNGNNTYRIAPKRELSSP